MRIRRFFRGGALICVALAVGIAPLGAQQPGHADPAFVIPIRGEINDVLSRSIERRLDIARERGAKLVIFEMDTPGGLVTSALDISKMIKEAFSSASTNLRSSVWRFSTHQTSVSTLTIALQSSGS